MAESPPTNELIGRLTKGLSPEGRAALERLETLEAEAVANAGPGETPDTAAALELLDGLPDGDWETVARIMGLKARALEARGNEYLERADELEPLETVFERAHELERAAGREPDPAMTLGEALAVLGRHGVDAPEIDTGRVVDVPRRTERAPTIWQIEGHAYGDESDPLAVPDEDGERVISNLEARVNDVGPHVPVRAEVYRGADKATVLRLLDKMRAHVEEYWEAR